METDDEMKELSKTLIHAEKLSNSIEFCISNHLIDTRVGRGTTALYLSCHLSLEKVAKTLISLGADVNARDNYKRTALSAAAYTGLTSICAILIGLGTDVDAREWTGDTPLLAAVGSDRRETALLLLKHGADPFVETIHKDSPYKYCVRYPYNDTPNDVSWMLRARGKYCWSQERLIWIGHLKGEKGGKCLLARLPAEILLLVISYFRGMSLLSSMCEPRGHLCK